ncbi:MAG: hypothetical protein RL096_596, partial [Actinomycetota bacterium]
MAHGADVKLRANPSAVDGFNRLRSGFETADKAGKAKVLSHIARDARRQIINTIDAAGQGHIGGDFSVIDVMTTLFYGVLNIDPADPTMPNRDRFILSKGHGAMAYYAALKQV